ncbi:uncharacterized protein LOC122526811 [Frieseomelitta varia]|uniref:uncharacterized protein LOC122526811 n=1 Tax=Frieseomelitta varia TaxID=561572 RepID=UPI001CB6A893|nr:uncharacterized protein LOC122526811 [Frieseomelitta varia]
MPIFPNSLSSLPTVLSPTWKERLRYGRGPRRHPGQRFVRATVAERIRLVKAQKGCLNCLRKGHPISECRSGACRVCQQRHNTMLHPDTTTSGDGSPQVHMTCLKTAFEPRVLLATDRFGHPIPCVLLDSCSQANFITTKLLCIGQIPLHTSLILQKTLLGWVVTGERAALTTVLEIRCYVTSEVHEQLTRFWEVEEGPRTHSLSEEERLCETHYTQHTRRDPQGGRGHHQDVPINTMTYGTASAPYLATRTLHQLASDEQEAYSRAAATFKSDFYMDDLITGADTYEDALTLRHELTQLANKGGFELRQWASNHPGLVPASLSNDNTPAMTIATDQTKKTLGLSCDSLRYDIRKFPNRQRVSKRIMLSSIAQLFNPLGLLGPVHGFCDASEKAYGACVYLKSTDQVGRTSVHLICSKSRVAPLKSQTLLRLELCAAVLLTKVVTDTVKALKMPLEPAILWTDSMIVLHWIKTPLHLLKTFVSNWVAQIQQRTQFSQWRHVPSQHNPADILSRGTDPTELVDNRLWYNGPQWVTDETNAESHGDTRATYNDRPKHNIRLIPGPRPKILTATIRILKLVQTHEFATDLTTIANPKTEYKGRLRALNPFIDENGLLRVGGRIARANVTSDARQPIILPAGHHITKLIIRQQHINQFHAGAQATSNAVRQNYWPLDGIQGVKNYIRTCTTCVRLKPTLPAYQMGNLPTERVTFERPFLATGIDYCGPILIKEKKWRNIKSIKAYVAIFVCLATKAVELVSDLTTEAFLAALKRFFTRRGKARYLFSDNAKTFVGANRELREVRSQLASNTSPVIHDYLTREQVTWHFIPPRAPNFGGIWEAAVKYMKSHLIKIIGNQLLTFETMNTYLIEIEAILNFRPITPISSDPNDLTALTPSHFLIGDVLTSTAEKDVTDVPTNSLRAFVIVKEDNLPVFCWPLGRITTLHPGDDQVVRVATVKTSSSEYKRCVRHLAPLPVESDQS